MANELIRQKIIAYSLALPSFPNFDSFKSWLKESHIHYEEGAFCFYIPPQEEIRGPFGALLSRYPPNSGLKILKDFQSPTQARYLSRKVRPRTTRVSDALAFRPLDFLRVANYMYDQGIGPRVYDLIEIQTAHNTLSAYIVQHVTGEIPTADEHADFVKKVEKLSRDQLVSLIPHWKSAKDFQGPDCNHNLVRDVITDKVLYVDFQAFMLKDAKRHILETASKIRKGVHFGNTHLIRGGRYLYQSIPGMELGKRDTSVRWASFKQLLSEQNVPIEGAVVLDIGCNAGMIIHAALTEGAFWAIGWDRPAVAAGAAKLLLSLGMTRFDIFGQEIYPDTAFALPAYIHQLNADGILFFLAMRKHIGFPESIRYLPFKCMVYEGHEEETLSDAYRYTQHIVDAWGLRVVAETSYTTGELKRERPVLLLCRDEM